MRMTAPLPGFAFALALGLAACSSAPPTRVESIAVEADPDANAGYATELDIVFAFSPEAVNALPPTGPEWFEKRDALQLGLADAVKVAHIQLPPARAASVVLPAGYWKAIGVFSFANYIPAPGQPRATLTTYPRITIRLSKDRIFYVQR
jgi:type VI secretion system protein